MKRILVYVFLLVLQIVYDVVLIIAMFTGFSGRVAHDVPKTVPLWNIILGYILLALYVMSPIIVIALCSLIVWECYKMGTLKKLAVFLRDNDKVVSFYLMVYAWLAILLTHIFFAFALNHGVPWGLLLYIAVCTGFLSGAVSVILSPVITIRIFGFIAVMAHIVCYMLLIAR